VSAVSSRELLSDYQRGDDEAAGAIFRQYVQRLIALAHGRLSTKLKRRIDAEDVVQSAFRSFFVHAQAREYTLAAPGDLWRLLAAITLNKLHGQVERHTAAKRSIHRESRSLPSAREAGAPEPTPAEVIAVVEELHLVLRSLTATEREVLTRTLQGESPEQVSAAIGKSTRTTRRLLANVRHAIEQRVLEKVPQPRHQRLQPEASLLFSDFTLGQMLGKGGMGKVYQAVDKRTARPVAIKALHKARQSDERAVARFVQEAQLVAGLQHPNIVAVHGLGRFPHGGFFLVMDLVRGSDLDTLLEAGPFSVCEAARIAGGIAAALDHAHARGIVHCDIKPANVLVDESGRVFVSDFGFAVLTSAGSTQTHGIGGTRGYIAPELLRGDQPTAAADIYALGMLLWKLSTREDSSAFRRRPPGNTALRAVHAICRRCTAKKPQDRFASAKELIAALTALETTAVSREERSSGFR